MLLLKENGFTAFEQMPASSGASTLPLFCLGISLARGSSAIRRHLIILWLELQMVLSFSYFENAL